MNRIGRPSRRLPLLLTGALAAWSLGGGSVRGDELTDHLTLLERLSAEAADEVLAQLAFPPGATVHVVAEVDHATNWLMIEALKQRLLARGYQVVVPALGQAPVGAEVVQAPTPAANAGQGQQRANTLQEIADQQQQEQGAQQGEASSEEASAEGDSGEEGAAQEGAAENQEQAGEAGEGMGEDQTGDQSGAAGAQERAQPVQGGQAGGSGQQGQGAAGAGASAAPFAMALPGEGEVLSFRVVECGVSYPWARRTLFIGKRNFGRMACVRLRASHVTEPGHRVAGVASSDRVHLDSFPAWARPMLEGQQFPFPIQEPPPTSARRILEPMVVAGIVGGLVYLFYENQK